MTKLVLDKIRQKTVTSGEPITNMGKDHPSQKETVLSKTNFKP
jgi:hypothetical protein